MTAVGAAPVDGSSVCAMCTRPGAGVPAPVSAAEVVITRCRCDGTRVAVYPDALTRLVLEERAGFVVDRGTFSGVRPPWDIGTAAEDAAIVKAVTMLRALDYTVEHPLAEPVTAPQPRGRCTSCDLELFTQHGILADRNRHTDCPDTTEPHQPASPYPRPR